MIDPYDLLSKYQQVREAQKGYFKTRDRAMLDVAKSLERDLDKEVQQCLDEKEADKCGKQADLGL